MNYSTNELNSHKIIPVFNSNGRMVGEVKGNVLCKHVKGSKHMLRVPRSWSIDQGIVEPARSEGATSIEITDDETGKVYRCSMQTFLENGIAINRGYGAQIALPLEYWTVNSPLVTGQLSLWA